MSSLRKLTSGETYGLQGISAVSAVFAWDGPLDGDLAFALGNHNTPLELVFPGNPVSALTHGAVKVAKDQRNGFGLNKADESGTIDFAAITRANAQLPPHQQITEVAVGVLVQTPSGRDPFINPATLGELQQAQVYLYNGREQMFFMDVDETFQRPPMDHPDYPGYPGGKTGEFKLINGAWRFVAEIRGFKSLDSMSVDLLKS